jgi:hypothetical protein
MGNGDIKAATGPYAPGHRGRAKRAWTEKAEFAVALACVAYVVLAVLAVRWLPAEASNPSSFTTADMLSLLTGAVTAMGLAGVYMQVKDGRCETDRRTAEQALEAALRADQLHAEYNSTEMQQPRVIAYEYLKFLKRRNQMDEYARNWLFDDERPCQVPKKLGPDGKLLTFDDYSNALDSMIAFFVRVSSHVKLHEPQLRNGELDGAEMIGPFFWPYWEQAGMPAFVAACKQLHEREGRGFDRPYFIDGLERLSELTQSCRCRTRLERATAPQASTGLPPGDPTAAPLPT